MIGVMIGPAASRTTGSATPRPSNDGARAVGRVDPTDSTGAVVTWPGGSRTGGAGRGRADHYADHYNGDSYKQWALTINCFEQTISLYELRKGSRSAARLARR